MVPSMQPGSGPGHGVISGGVVVVGSGTARAAVDRASVTCGVEITADDAGHAFRAAAASAAAVLTAVARHGVAGRAVRTLDVTLGPRYDYVDGGQRLVGYQATQRLVVTVDELPGLGELLTSIASAADGVRIDAVTLEADNPRAAGSDARTAAMIDAREKAMSFAALAGRPLGQVVSVEEQGEGASPRQFALAAHAARDWSMPIAAGETDVALSVRVHFAWAD